MNWMDMIVGAFKFLLNLFWSRTNAPSEFFYPLACDLWMVLGLYWVVSSFRTKAMKSRESRAQRLGYEIFVASGLVLLFSSRAHYSWLGMRFAPDTRTLAAAGLGLTAAGIALAMWARLILGENWSAIVSIRKDHELIRVGPYRIIRHPIYTGILLGIVGTALIVGEVRGLVGLFIVWLGFYYKARREEAILSQEFGGQFLDHARRTGMFLPRFS